MVDPASAPERPAQPPAPERDRPRRRIWAVAATVVLALGGVTYSGVRAMRDTDPITKSVTAPARSTTPSTAPAAVSTPRASSYPVRTTGDLKRVCEQWYYPKSPKVRSAGIQPVSIFSKDSKDIDTRHEATLFDIPNWYTAQKQKAWGPAAPAKVRLVACVDLVYSGKQVKTCEFDDPKGPELPMREGKYRLTLYEVATGRKVVEKRLAGEDEKCPFMVPLGTDRTIYSTVGDRQLYEALKKHVEAPRR